MKLYFNIILLLLVPAILLSDDWERVDLPNLNNGGIKNFKYLDGYYYFNKWDGSFVKSQDLLKWEEVDLNKLKDNDLSNRLIDSISILKKKYRPVLSSYYREHFAKDGVMFYDRSDSVMYYSNYQDLDEEKITGQLNINPQHTRFANSLDNSLYFYTDSVFYIFENSKLDSLELNGIYNTRQSIYAFKYKNELQILVEKSQGRTFKSTLYSTVIEDNKLKPNKKIFTDLSTASSIFQANDFLIAERKDNLIAVDLKTNYERVFDLIIPNNKYIYDFYIRGDTINLHDYPISEYSISMTSNTSYCYEFDDEYRFNHFQKHDIWDIKFNITEFEKKSDNGEYISKYEFNIYDSNEVKVKVIELVEGHYTNDWIRVVEKNDEFALINLNSKLIKLNRDKMEIEEIKEPKGNILKEGDILILPSSIIDSISYQYSKDMGETWQKHSFYKKLSRYSFISSCTTLDNYYRFHIVGENINLFAFDSVYYTQLGSDKLELLGAYENSEVFRSDDILYFLEKSDGRIYSIDDGNKIEEIRTDNIDIGKIIVIDLENGYLYASDYYNLFRLKLE